MRNAKPCGCEQGGIGLLFGLACCALYFMVTGSWHSAGYAELWFTLAFLVLTTGVGKIIGIQVESRRLREKQSGSGQHNNATQAGRGFSHSNTQSFWKSDPSRCCGRR